jgi:copper transport protein
MVNAFSPAALVFAGTAAATGVISAAFQLGALSALWTSAYGRTLLLKLAVVGLVIAAGAYNWRRLRPALADSAPVERLRTSGGAELIGAAVVLLITAILVAVPTP